MCYRPPVGPRERRADSDFTVGWYENVGGQLLTTMFFNIITPHIYPLGAYALYRWKHRESVWPTLVKAAKSQRDLNEDFIGPYNDCEYTHARPSALLPRERAA